MRREDLNPLDRAKAFRQLADQFGLQHKEIGVRVGKSREYVSNTLRILLLPKLMQDALEKGEISEGHTRPLLMLADKIDAQMTLFKEIIERRLTVRDTEALARRAAIERVRHKALVSPDLMSLEKELSERLGTRVRIEKKDTGGKVMIDFFSPEDLTQLCLALTTQQQKRVEDVPTVATVPAEKVPDVAVEAREVSAPPSAPSAVTGNESDDLYSINNFSV